jgi:hypothetical protein
MLNQMDEMYSVFMTLRYLKGEIVKINADMMTWGRQGRFVCAFSMLRSKIYDDFGNTR